MFFECGNAHNSEQRGCPKCHNDTIFHHIPVLRQREKKMKLVWT
jgi:hypothetical protein